jgi:hypothetical protein
MLAPPFIPFAPRFPARPHVPARVVLSEAGNATIGRRFQRRLKRCDESNVKNAADAAIAARQKCPIGAAFRDALTDC